MKRKHTVAILAGLLLMSLGAGSVLSLRQVEAARGEEATLQDVLYLPSASTIKHLGLGYSGLLADIYWARTVQYFGSQFQHRTQHRELLYPLLQITTDLDPHLLPAYQIGAIFLTLQKPTGGADKAVALLEKSTRANPEYWPTYFTLGFVHYMDRKDYKAAQDAFEKGSEIPSAPPWMKVMAARMAEQGSDVNMAIALWRGVYEMTKQDNVRETAAQHILSLQADALIDELQRRTKLYKERTGSFPEHWSDMVRAGLLRESPKDPTGVPFLLGSDGTVAVQNPSDFRFLGEWHPDRH